MGDRVTKDQIGRITEVRLDNDIESYHDFITTLIKSYNELVEKSLVYESWSFEFMMLMEFMKTLGLEIDEDSPCMDTCEKIREWIRELVEQESEE